MYCIATYRAKKFERTAKNTRRHQPTVSSSQQKQATPAWRCGRHHLSFDFPEPFNNLTLPKRKQIHHLGLSTGKQSVPGNYSEICVRQAETGENQAKTV
jgi:hypothetical protein